jgi:hypothetical protein
VPVGEADVLRGGGTVVLLDGGADGLLDGGAIGLLDGGDEVLLEETADASPDREGIGLPGARLDGLGGPWRDDRRWADIASSKARLAAVALSSPNVRAKKGASG